MSDNMRDWIIKIIQIILIIIFIRLIFKTISAIYRLILKSK